MGETMGSTIFGWLGLAALLVFLLAIVRAAFRVEVVHEWESALLYVDGRFSRVLAAGRHRIFALNRTVAVHRLPRLDFGEAPPPTDVLTSDRFALRIGVFALVKIRDARKVVEGQYLHTQKFRQALADALVAVAAERTLETLLAERAQLGAAVLARLGDGTEELEVTGIHISAVTLPPETRRILTEVERAKLEGQAALERARAEHASLRSLANAARLLKDNPELMRLRTLQAVSPTGKGATLVLGQDVSFRPVAD